MIMDNILSVLFYILHIRINKEFFLDIYLFICLVFLGPYRRHVEVPRLGVESEL